MTKKAKKTKELSKFRVLRAISWFGERRDKGEVIEMKPEDAHNIGSDYLEEILKDGGEDGSDETGKDDSAGASAPAGSSESQEGGQDGEGKEIDI